MYFGAKATNQYYMLEVKPVKKQGLSHIATKYKEPLKYYLSWYSLHKDGSIQFTLVDNQPHYVDMECSDVFNNYF